MLYPKTSEVIDSLLYFSCNKVPIYIVNLILLLIDTNCILFNSNRVTEDVYTIVPGINKKIITIHPIFIYKDKEYTTLDFKGTLEYNKPLHIKLLSIFETELIVESLIEFKQLTDVQLMNKILIIPEYGKLNN